MTDPNSRLIIKAALHHKEDVHDTRYKGLVGSTRLKAFAEVAADILGFGGAPFAFEQAIKIAVAQHPFPTMQTANRVTAVDLRERWEAAILEAVFTHYLSVGIR